MTLLTIVQDAMNELGLTAPGTVIGNTDPQIVQFLALANREGKEFAAMPGGKSGWPEMRKEYTFALVPVGPYTGDVTKGSTTIANLSSVSGIVANTFGVSGTGIYQSAMVTSVGANSVVLSIPASATGTGVSLQFGQVAYALPSDLGFFISATFWDRNFRWQMLGPLSAQEWQVIQSGISPVGPRLRYRIMDGLFYIQPVPGSSQTDQIAFEYISTSWCNSAGGTGQAKWTADTDTYLWPDEIATLGLKWRYLRAKGLDYAEEYRTWDMACQRQLARSGGSRSLPLNATSGNVNLLSSNNVPDTGFGA